MAFIMWPCSSIIMLLFFFFLRGWDSKISCLHLLSPWSLSVHLAGQISVLSSKWNTYPPGWGGLRNSIQKKGRLRSREGSGSQARSTPLRLVLFPSCLHAAWRSKRSGQCKKENQCFTSRGNEEQARRGQRCKPEELDVSKMKILQPLPILYQRFHQNATPSEEKTVKKWSDSGNIFI